mgnify:CR=1 FL=1
MGRVQDKVALVTGGASGLGKADCLLLAEEGAKVAIADIDIAGATALAEQIGEAAIAIKLDVSSETDWKAALATVKERFGGLNILVNNAGIVVVADPEETTLEQFRKVQSVMSEGVFLGCKYSIPLIARSGGGSIINMSSTASHLGYPPFFAYSAAKGAVRSLTKSVAMHCQQKGYGIRCNSVHPGAAQTVLCELVAGRQQDRQLRAVGVARAGLGDFDSFWFCGRHGE